MKKVSLIITSLIIAISTFAQKQTFDIVSYESPKGWAEKQETSAMSYSKVDGSNWAQIAIYNHTNSDGDIQADFNKEWNELMVAGKNISAPEKTNPETQDGWTVISGSGTWQYNGAKVASILTVFSNNKVRLSVVCNATAKAYLQDYLTLIGSLKLDATGVTESPGTGNNTTAPAQNNNSNSIAGTWINSVSESRGLLNGFNMYTGGYMRKEYVFKEDGTYMFRQKDWMAARDNIYFAYETGTYVVKGNQLTLTPKTGKAGWWNKDNVGHDVKKWGSYQKAEKYKLETVTYAFQFETSDYGKSLLLNYDKATQRDGDHPSGNGQYTSYSRDEGKSRIDNPPGFKN
ncbi:MAG: hypothetical protein JST09_14710 [Bacteroidetes bacterium]|nr:hypothetical protein [Bacteroidota bacterium]MBS1610356.1 hypothetical protein [Bacteroidota bacterium]